MARHSPQRTRRDAPTGAREAGGDDAQWAGEGGKGRSTEHGSVGARASVDWSVGVRASTRLQLYMCVAREECARKKMIPPAGPGHRPAPHMVADHIGYFR